MQPVLPFRTQAGVSEEIRVDLTSGKIRPANPRTIAILLANTWVAGRLPELRSSVLADSILLADDVSKSVPAGLLELSRIMGALHYCGKAFGGDIDPQVPASVRNVVDGYHFVCRLSVLSDLDLPDAPEPLLRPIARSASRVSSGLLDERRKLLPGRVDRLVSAFASLFKVGRDLPLMYADATRFVPGPDSATRTVDLRPLYREGRAVVVPRGRR